MHVIYGGTFDPIHHGHLRLAVELRERLAVAEVALMPCHVPPHRDVPGATSEQRVALLELAIAGEPGLAMDDRELRRGGASYTAETLRQLRGEIGPEKSLAIVLGTDSFAGFDRWQEWQRIPELAHIIVVQRPGPGLAPESVPARLLKERSVAQVDALYDAPCGHILQLEPPMLDISATGIRDRILSGHSPRYLMPDSVWQEIRRLGLYGACPDGIF